MTKTPIYFVLLILSTVSAKATNYYVNDGTLDGNDTYTTAVGAGGNNGLAPNTPKASINDVIATYALTGNDTVFIDAGTFTEFVTLTSADDGSAGNFTVFKGVDSALTTIAAPAGFGNHCISLQGADYTKWEGIYFSANGDDNGVEIIDDSDNNEITNCRINQPNFGWAVWVRNGAGAEPDDNMVYHNKITAQRFGISVGGPATNLPDGNDFYLNDISVVANGGGNKSFEIDGGINTKFYSNRCVGGGRVISLNTDYNGTEVYNNYIVNTANPSYGITLSENSSHTVDIYNNSIYVNGTCLWIDDAVPADPTNVSVTNNIFHTTSTSSSDYCINNLGTNTNFLAIDYNQYYHPNAAQAANMNSTAYAALTNWQGVDHESGGANGDGNSQEGDPGFADAANADLDVTSTSPVYNNGTTIAGITDDIIGTSRPQGVSYDIGAFEVLVPTPVDLIKFEAHCGGETIDFDWITANEVNNDFFSLEYSPNALQFEVLTETPGSINETGLHFYAAELSSELSGYFRLRQTDFDGSSTTSKTIHVSCEHGFDFQRHRDGISIHIPNINTTYNVEIYSVPGQLMFQKSYVDHAFETIELSHPDLSTSSFIVKVSSDSRMASRKFISW